MNHYPTNLIKTNIYAYMSVQRKILKGIKFQQKNLGFRIQTNNMQNS